MLPVTWVYMSARWGHGYNQSVVQALIVLPMIVAGVVLIVRNSLALAFSLGGVVAAVRFRTNMSDSRDIVFIFLAIAVGFAAGVQDIMVALTLSFIFNFVLVFLWRYDFGRTVLEPTAVVAVGRAAARSRREGPRRRARARSRPRSRADAEESRGAGRAIRREAPKGLEATASVLGPIHGHICHATVVPAVVGDLDLERAGCPVELVPVVAEAGSIDLRREVAAPRKGCVGSLDPRQDLREAIREGRIAGHVARVVLASDQRQPREPAGRAVRQPADEECDDRHHEHDAREDRDIDRQCSDRGELVPGGGRWDEGADGKRRDDDEAEEEETAAAAGR